MRSSISNSPELNVIDWKRIREDFPILERSVNGYPLVYLDNAATSQKPRAVIDSIVNYYEYLNANVHRGVHTLSTIGTEEFEKIRFKVRDFINARSEKEIIFTGGTTASVNTVSYSFGRKFVSIGDEVLISGMEHHSNTVPWQILCESTGAKLRVIPVTESGELNLDEFRNLLNEKTRIVSVSYVSNALGTINPIKEIVAIAHQYDVPVFVDGAQSSPHLNVDVQDLDCDFYAFSGHKMYGSTGIGVLYGKEKLLEDMPPFLAGGEMIRHVTFEKTTYSELPFKFEPGTPNIEGVIGLGAAIDYLLTLGMELIAKRDHNLLKLATEKLSEINGFVMYGRAKEKAGVLSFNIGKIHPLDLGTLLDKMGIAVRTGHHCCQPLMDFYCIPGTVRASFSFYNNEEDIERLVTGVHKAVSMLS